MQTQSTNPAAERARYYVSHYGSADAALTAVDQPAQNDAFDRAVCDELRALQCAEWETARIATVQKASLFMQGIAA